MAAGRPPREGLVTERLARRLLGPAGDDPGCEGTLGRLDELAELGPALATPAGPLVAVTRHLEACPDCREDYEGLRELVRSRVGPS